MENFKDILKSVNQNPTHTITKMRKYQILYLVWWSYIYNFKDINFFGKDYYFLAFKSAPVLNTFRLNQKDEDILLNPSIFNDFEKLSFIKKYTSHFNKFSTKDLIGFTTKPFSPWEKYYKEGLHPNKIPTTQLIRYFRNYNPNMVR